MKIILILLVATLSVGTKANDCELPSKDHLETRLQVLVNGVGGDQNDVIITVQDGPFYTCQVQGTIKGTYQMVSVIMTYTDDSGSPDLRIRQFELECLGSGSTDWDEVSNSLITIDSNVDYTNIVVFTNCSSCDGSASNNDNHCVACHSDCNVGLMRCTGTASSECCVAFEDDGMCSPDLGCDENNFVANKQNNFTCACGISSCSDGYLFNSTTCNCDLTDICIADNHCVNDGECTLETAPDQFTCNCPYFFDDDSNCSVCILNCTGGEFQNQNCSNCVNICDVDDPCKNGGVCMPNSDDLYLCDCQNTSFSGKNCSDCNMVCITSAGNYLNEDLCLCEFNDVCETDAPCENDGRCVPFSSPGYDYECMCANNYGDENCTECTLMDCNGNGVADKDCISCDCRVGYTSYDCSMTDYCASSDNCTGRGNCSNLSDGFECTCQTGHSGRMCESCSSGYSNRSNSCEKTGNDSSFQWWWVVVPIVIAVIIVALIALIIIVIVVAREKCCNADDTIL